MRFLLLCLLLFNFSEGWDGAVYPPESIMYAGMTIECIEGCGSCDDPKMQKAWRILEKATKDTFGKYFLVVKEKSDTTLIGSPVRCSDTGDFENWDRKATEGVCPSDEEPICYKRVWVYNYPVFLEVARELREDVRFYYFTARKMVQEFETNLAAKLEAGLAQGYNIYRIFPGGEIEFEYLQGWPTYISLDSGWERITVKLNSLSWRDWKEEKSVFRREEAYKQAEDRIEEAIAEMDTLFRRIFVYCLEHHQPEGIEFSSAIESLLAGNLAKGIDHIRRLIEIGESRQFPSELIAKMQLLKGQLEVESRLYSDAILSLTEAIVKNPDLKETYLERGTAYFQIGEYGSSMEDYLSYATRIQSVSPFSIQGFSSAFAKNLISGCCDSGRGLYLLLSDFAQRPIHTVCLIGESLALLSKLAGTNEWKLLAEAVVPEIHQLLVEWDTLSFEKRGELAGYAFGKHGADLLMPVALAKAASKGLRCVSEVSIVYKNLRAADQTLLLESLSSLKGAAKIEEAVMAAQEATFLGEELSLTAREMGQLKQAGTLETTLSESYRNLCSSVQESVTLHKKAREILKPYAKKPMPESRVRELIHEVGIPTFPRPNGIPQNYIVTISEKGAGMKYVDPINRGSYVRVMPGKPHSPYPYQQQPYAIQMKDGNTLDKYGDIVSKKAPEAHIPLSEFIYRN